MADIEHPIKMIKEYGLFIKYKSSYQSAFIDLSFHTILTSSAFYLLWMFRNSLMSIFTVPFLGLLLHRNFIIFHDCSHNSYTPSKIFNKMIATICGIITFTSTNWILDHHIHHKTNGNRENKYNFKFNETVYWNKKEYLNFSLFSKAVFTFFHTPIVFFTAFPILYFFIIQRIIYMVKKYKYKEKIKSSYIRILNNHLINNLGCMMMCSIAHENDVLYHLLIASYIGFLINFLLFFNQHTFNPPYVVGDAEWSQQKSGLLGSSFIQIPKLLKYFTMGIEYHHIHHMSSLIPGYNLQKYHEEVISSSNIFDNIIRLSMTDCLNNLWMVLYDNDRMKYTSIAEVSEEIQKNKNL